MGYVNLGLNCLQGLSPRTFFGAHLQRFCCFSAAFRHPPCTAYPFFKNQRDRNIYTSKKPTRDGAVACKTGGCGALLFKKRCHLRFFRNINCSERFQLQPSKHLTRSQLPLVLYTAALLFLLECAAHQQSRRAWRIPSTRDAPPLVVATTAFRTLRYFK